MTNDIVEEFKKDKGFKEVLHEREARQSRGVPTLVPHSTLRLTGTVIKFSKFLVVANTKFIDTAANEVVFERKVDGRAVMGGSGGKSTSATHALAKKLAWDATGYFCAIN
jgi:hypothetical protein